MAALADSPVMPRSLPELALGGVIFFVYVWLCVRVALYAERKGRSFFLLFVVGFLVSPAVSGLIAMVLPDPLREDLR